MTLLVLLLSAACADGINHHSSDIETRIQDTRDEVDRHHSTIFALQDVSDVPAETQRHSQRMLALMVRMQGSISDMSHCSEGTRGGMREMMDDMETNLEKHLVSLAVAPTLDEARSECVAHAEAMNDGLDSMRDRAMRSACMRRW